MNQLEEGLRRIADALDRGAVKWALVGGFAVSARVEPRFTRDIDLAVAVDGDAAAESLVRSLMSSGYELFASVEQEAVGRLATVRFVDGHSKGRESVVDLLFASSGIEREIAQDSEPLEILPGLTVPVAQVGHLIAVKLLARDDENRPQDIADLRALVADATPQDLVVAETAVGLIEERGYQRDRDLRGALREFTGG
jgi:predicted nucleotidyltransferase